MLIDPDEIDVQIFRPRIEKVVARPVTVAADFDLGHRAEVMAVQFVELPQQRSVGRRGADELDHQWCSSSQWPYSHQHGSFGKAGCKRASHTNSPGTKTSYN